ncbi:hypothetical protein F5Y04DRAFT_265681 [Hypomontagnella monticulosa]|nr:hypothetical protein F5Y04DRAFT_265681 [Hypomontagnella monticulosa]
MAGHLNYTPAQVVCNRGGTCPIQHLISPEKKAIPKPKEWPDLRGLNALQASREEWVNGDAIDKALTMVHLGLHADVKGRIQVIDTNIRNMFNLNITASKPDEFENILNANYPRWFALFSTTEFTLWPINFDSCHWVLCVMRKTNPTGKKGGWNHITHFCILDSWVGWADHDDATRRRFLEQRIKRFVSKLGFMVAAEARREVWVPRQLDYWSCGLRTYWAARRMMDRIRELELGEYTDQEALWRPLTGGVDCDFVRWEMIGLNISAAIRQMGYGGRAAIEIVSQVRAGGELQDAGEVMRWDKPGATGKSPDESLKESEKKSAKKSPEKPSYKWAMGVVTPKGSRTAQPATPAAPGQSQGKAQPGPTTTFEVPTLRTGSHPLPPIPSQPRIATDWSVKENYDATNTDEMDDIIYRSAAPVILPGPKPPRPPRQMPPPPPSQPATPYAQAPQAAASSPRLPSWPQHLQPAQQPSQSSPKLSFLDQLRLSSQAASGEPSSPPTGQKRGAHLFDDEETNYNPRKGSNKKQKNEAARTRTGGGGKGGKRGGRPRADKK